MLDLSDAGLRFIKAHEGFRSHLYNDSRGFATIGYGHLVHLGPVGSDPAREAPFANGLAEAPAELLLRRDARVAIGAVRAYARANLQQYEFDALVSFTYNVGATAFEHSTLLRRVNTLATPDAIESAWLMYCKPPEILHRRRDEIALFLHASYGGAVP